MDVFTAFNATLPPTSLSLDVPGWVQYAAVLVACISGAIFACVKEFDLVGAIALAITSGFGGGIVRDLLLQEQGIYFLENPLLVVLVALMAVLVFYFESLIKHFDAMIFFFDTIALGLFASVGANTALLAGMSFVPSVLMGSITAFGGGVMRDMMAGEAPQAFKPANYYGIAAFFGSIVFVALSFAGVEAMISLPVCVIATALLRYLSFIFDWRTSAPHDLTPGITRSVKGIAHRATSLRGPSASRPDVPLEGSERKRRSWPRKKTPPATPPGEKDIPDDRQKPENDEKP